MSNPMTDQWNELIALLRTHADALDGVPMTADIDVISDVWPLLLVRMPYTSFLTIDHTAYGVKVTDYHLWDRTVLVAYSTIFKEPPAEVPHEQE